MRITRITLWPVDLPLARSYALSGGRLRFECLDSTIARLDTDEGLAGWGDPDVPGIGARPHPDMLGDPVAIRTLDHPNR